MSNFRRLHVCSVSRCECIKKEPLTCFYCSQQSHRLWERPPFLVWTRPILPIACRSFLNREPVGCLEQHCYPYGVTPYYLCLDKCACVYSSGCDCVHRGCQAVASAPTVSSTTYLPAWLIVVVTDIPFWLFCGEDSSIHPLLPFLTKAKSTYGGIHTPRRWYTHALAHSHYAHVVLPLPITPPHSLSSPWCSLPANPRINTQSPRSAHAHTGRLV